MQFKSWILKEWTKEQSFTLAALQRDLPEDAMLKVQRINGGGVLNPLVEHIGDLIHRMTEKPTFESAGYVYVKDKVEKCLRSLNHPYGFSREMFDNIQNNARFYKVPAQELKSRIFEALEEYARAHEKLPVYNTAQELARNAAISVGRLKFQETIFYLNELKKHLVTQDEWIKFAHDGLQ